MGLAVYSLGGKRTEGRSVTVPECMFHTFLIIPLIARVFSVCIIFFLIFLFLTHGTDVEQTPTVCMVLFTLAAASDWPLQCLQKLYGGMGIHIPAIGGVLELLCLNVYTGKL